MVFGVKDGDSVVSNELCEDCDEEVIAGEAVKNGGKGAGEGTSEA